MGVMVSFVQTKTDRDAAFAYAGKQLYKRMQCGWFYKLISWVCGIGLGLFFIKLFELRQDVLDFATHTYAWVVGCITLFFVTEIALVCMRQSRTRQVIMALPADAGRELSVTVELSDEGMTIIDPYSRSEVKWVAIPGVEEDAKYLFVELMGCRYLGIPKTAFASTQMLAEFQRYIQARTGRPFPEQSFVSGSE